MKFSVESDGAAQATWHLRASNGELVAWAGEHFASASKSNAERAAESVRASAGEATGP